MQNLFDENEKWTEQAISLETEVMGALRPIIEIAAKHYPMRQIEYVIQQAVGLYVCEQILYKGLNRGQDK